MCSSRSTGNPARRALGATVGSAMLAVLLAGGVRAEESQPVAWQGIERVVAFADVHGAYAELTALLRSVGVVDEDLRWTGGRTHLVSLGDLLDRGADSRKVMDLLMRLQGEAATAGGRVHVVLGNHEAMNVLGDLRYVDPRRVRGICGRGAPRSARRAACRVGGAKRRGFGGCVRREIPAGILRPSRSLFASRSLRTVAARPAGGHRRQRQRLHARRPIEGPGRPFGAGDQPALPGRVARLSRHARGAGDSPTGAARGPVLGAAGTGAAAPRRRDHRRRGQPRSHEGRRREIRRGRSQSVHRARRPQLVSRRGTVQRVLRSRRAGPVPGDRRRSAPGDRSHRRARHARRLALRRAGRQARCRHESGGLPRPPRGADARSGRRPRVVRRRPRTARGDSGRTALRGLPFARRCPRRGDPGQRHGHGRWTALARDHRSLRRARRPEGTRHLQCHDSRRCPARTRRPSRRPAAAARSRSSDGRTRGPGTTRRAAGTTGSHRDPRRRAAGQAAGRRLVCARAAVRADVRLRRADRQRGAHRRSNPVRRRVDAAAHRPRPVLRHGPDIAGAPPGPATVARSRSFGVVSPRSTTPRSRLRSATW